MVVSPYFRAFFSFLILLSCLAIFAWRAAIFFLISFLLAMGRLLVSWAPWGSGCPGSFHVCREGPLHWRTDSQGRGHTAELVCRIVQFPGGATVAAPTSAVGPDNKKAPRGRFLSHPNNKAKGDQAFFR